MAKMHLNNACLCNMHFPRNHLFFSFVRWDKMRSKNCLLWTTAEASTKYLNIFLVLYLESNFSYMLRSSICSNCRHKLRKANDPFSLVGPLCWIRARSLLVSDIKDSSEVLLLSGSSSSTFSWVMSVMSVSSTSVAVRLERVDTRIPKSCVRLFW